MNAAHIDIRRIDIRKASAADAPRLFEVWRSAVAATHDFVRPEDHAEIARLVRESYLTVADLDVAVYRAVDMSAERDAEGGGLALAFMGMSGMSGGGGGGGTGGGSTGGAEIDSLFVHAEARGLGLGRRLVELAFTRAEVIRAEVNEQNVQGLGFWRHMGFRQIGRMESDRQGRPYPLVLMEWRG